MMHSNKLISDQCYGDVRSITNLFGDVGLLSDIITNVVKPSAQTIVELSGANNEASAANNESLKTAAAVLPILSKLAV